MATLSMLIHTPRGNRIAESVNKTYKHTPCGYVRTVTSTVAVDRSWNNRYDYDNSFHENLD